MERHPATLWRRRVLAAAFAVAATAATAWAEAIKITKPAVEIAAPPKEQPNLPKTRYKAVDIPTLNQMEAPMAVPPPPPVMRPKTRDQDDDELSSRHPLLRPLDQFPDAVGRDNERNPKLSSSNQKSARAQSSSAFGGERRETEPSLSPIINPDRDLRDRDSDRRRNDSVSPNLLTKFDRMDRMDRNEVRQKGLYEQKGGYESLEQNDPGRANDLNSAGFDSFTFRPKTDPTSARAEQRAAFEQLLNPNSPPGRPTGSLEPVSGLESPKLTAPIGMPMLGGGVLEKNLAGPSEAFRGKQSRPYGAAGEDLPKQFSQQTKPVVPATGDSPIKSSLMRQPTVHDVPSRKF